MRLRVTVIFQLAAAFAQIVVPTIPDFPVAYVPTLHAVISFCQMAQAIVAHQIDPHAPPIEPLPVFKSRPPKDGQ